jgi:hypothetical protein
MIEVSGSTIIASLGQPAAIRDAFMRNVPLALSRNKEYRIKDMINKVILY